MSDHQAPHRKTRAELRAMRKAYFATAASFLGRLFYETGRPVSVVDLKNGCPPPPEIDGPGTMGNVFRVALPTWTCVGFGRSQRFAHGRVVTEYAPPRSGYKPLPPLIRPQREDDQ